jgi:hypothetical protein
VALIKCKECGRDVSSKAKTCPNCGVKAGASQVGCGSVLLLLFLGGLLLSALNDPSGSSNNASPPETAEQRAVREKQDKAMARATVGAKILKKAMRDPDSFKLESALVIDKTDAVCYEYRAKNGFGGVNLGKAVLASDGSTFKTDDMSGFSQLWNKECANKTGTNAATAIRWFAL